MPSGAALAAGAAGQEPRTSGFRRPRGRAEVSGVPSQHPTTSTNFLQMLLPVDKAVSCLLPPRQVGHVDVAWGLLAAKAQLSTGHNNCRRPLPCLACALPRCTQGYCPPRLRARVGAGLGTGSILSTARGFVVLSVSRCLGGSWCRSCREGHGTKSPASGSASRRHPKTCGSREGSQAGRQ